MLDKLLFWKRNSPPDWITAQEGNIIWIEEWILNLLDIYGGDQFERSHPILVSASTLSHREDTPHNYLTVVAEDMAQQARIPIQGVKLDLYDEVNASEIMSKSGLEHSGSSSGSAGKFYKIDRRGYAHIAIEEDQLQDHIALAGTIAHELAHAFLHIRRPPRNRIWKPADEELITDICSVLLGFGIFACNSAERFVKTGNYRTTSWSASVQGYLTLEQVSYTQAIVNELFNQDFKAYRHHLSDNPRYFTKQAIGHYRSLSEPGSQENADFA